MVPVHTFNNYTLHNHTMQLGLYRAVDDLVHKPYFLHDNPGIGLTYRRQNVIPACQTLKVSAADAYVQGVPEKRKFPKCAFHGRLSVSTLPFMVFQLNWLRSICHLKDL